MRVKDGIWKKLHTEWLQLHDILQRQNYGYSKKISSCQELEEEKEEQAEHKGFFRIVKTLYDTMVETYIFVITLCQNP